MANTESVVTIQPHNGDDSGDRNFPRVSRVGAALIPSRHAIALSMKTDTGTEVDVVLSLPAARRLSDRLQEKIEEYLTQDGPPDPTVLEQLAASGEPMISSV